LLEVLAGLGTIRIDGAGPGRINGLQAAADPVLATEIEATVPPLEPIGVLFDKGVSQANLNSIIGLATAGSAGQAVELCSEGNAGRGLRPDPLGPVPPTAPDGSTPPT
jgi:hypothetical protein